MNKWLLFFLVLPFASFGQEKPYELNWKLDGPLLGGAISLTVTELILLKNVNVFTEDEINALDINNVLPFDRISSRHYSQEFRSTSDILFYSSFAAPFSILNKKTKNSGAVISVMALETMLVTNALTSMTKVAVLRPRPLVYNDEVPLGSKLAQKNKLSFFSGHTSMAASSFFYTAKVFSDFYPNSKWKPLVWTVAAIVPAVVGMSRVYGGKHFPTDVIVGYIVGAGTGILIPHLHRTKKKGNDKLTFK